MLLIEFFVPRGAFSAEAQHDIGRRVVDRLMVEDSHAVEVLDAQRAITQVLFHEPTTWVLGQRPCADAADPPRFLVRVTVPASWRKEVSGPFVQAITEVLEEAEAEAGRDPGRLRRDPHLIVLVDGISEGGVGIHGRQMSTLDLTELVSRGYRSRTDVRNTPPQGSVIDPVCGMEVELDASTPTLTYDGVLYGFCHGLCRRSFADEHRLDLDARSAED
ncbi:hypothetical protein [Yinghuangia sp. YIM S09857]|uniref:hypothetical protein n=1 Tax=Yinghuangia sp. YIM S09857 TaxID=3436929 RepID=UPI003F53D448